MENLIIPKKDEVKYLPGVFFDAETGICEIKGESFMESPDKFYNPLYEWLNRYYTRVGKPIKFHLKLTYFNTASSKFLIELFKSLKSYQDKGGIVEIYWYYLPEDEDMKDEIEEISLETEIQINAVELEE